MGLWKKETKAPSPGLKNIKNVIAVASGKGGVGKSSVATNLAYVLKEKGHSVGLLDADIYGPCQPKMLGGTSEKPIQQGSFIVPPESLGIKFVSMGLLMPKDDAVIWRAPMAMKIIQQFLANVLWGELDFLIIDLPPGTGDVQITLAQQAQLTGAVMVTTPQKVALEVTKRGAQMFGQVNVPLLGIIENMSGMICNHCNKEVNAFGKGSGKTWAEESKIPFLGSLPIDPTIASGSDSGTPVSKMNKSSLVAKRFEEIVTNLENQLESMKTTPDWGRPLDITIDQKGNLHSIWPDGHQGIHSAHLLRSQCPCASCVDENTGKRILDPHTVPLDIKISQFMAMGRYAIAPTYSDGHNSGIIKFSTLKSLCECAACLHVHRKENTMQQSFQV